MILPSVDPRSSVRGVVEGDTRRGDVAYVRLDGGFIACSFQAGEDLKDGERVVYLGIFWWRDT